MESTAGKRLGWSGAVLLIAAFSLIPVLWIISLSFKDPATLADGSFIPTKWTWSNYSSIFSQTIFTDALRNSIGIAIIATVIAVFIASFAAYAIARLDFPGKNIVLGASLGIAMFPPISLVGPLYNLWRSIGLYDTWPGLIIPYMTFALPLSIFVLSSFFREIPWELEQAAQVDGATPFQAFRKVIAPLAAPGIFTTAILVFLFCWNDFVFASTLTSTNSAQTVPAALAAFPGRIAVHRADRHDRRRSGDRDDSSRHHRAPVPAPDRLRPDRGRRQGIRRTHGPDRSRAHHQALRRRLRGRQGPQPGHRRRRVHDPGRPVGLRQVDGAADGRRAGGHHRRRAEDRRPGRQRQGAQGPRHRDGVPELRPVPAHDRAREHGLRAQAGQDPPGRDRPEGL